MTCSPTRASCTRTSSGTISFRPRTESGEIHGKARKGARRDSAAWTARVADLVECILAWHHHLRWTEWTGARSVTISFDDFGLLERARERERGSGTASPGCRANESFLGGQTSGTILVGKDQLLAKSFLWSTCDSATNNTR